MENQPSPTDGSRELLCVGKLEIISPKPVGFLCGSIPVLTENSFHAFNSALIPSRQKVRAPQYRMLPTETDLNRPPLLSDLSEKLLPIGVVPPRTFPGDLSWEDGALKANLSRKCEALAVSGLAEYGEEIDVIAPTDILKQIFKMPYSKARLSIAVHRIGQTLVLNTGPDVEEGEKLFRRHTNTNQSKCADQTLFLNFAMHSVRMEACDCPPTRNSGSSNHQPKSSVLPEGDVSHLVGQHSNIAQNEQLKPRSDYARVKQDDFIWGSKKNERNKRRDPIQKTSQVGEKPRCSMQESERHRRVGNDGFLRVLFWQFHNFRMLLGSDLLLFSNEKYVAVSLHLWDVTRQVTPLTWLEAWLDNVMASVPELAICYHENGVVQGYELLKTEDIFLLKGISDDGTPAFNPHVVQQNGLSVLRFLQENCKQDPGTYWLYKSAGEDVIQLFDLSVIPKTHSSNKCDDSSSSLPSLLHRGRSDSIFSLGTLLYRIAHRLSLSMATESKVKCASFIRKCLDFLDEPDHLVVCAYAHEQYARLILNNDDDTDVASDCLPVESEVTVTDAEEESMDFLSSITDSVGHEDTHHSIGGLKLSDEGSNHQDFPLASPVEMTSEANASASGSPGSDERFAVCKMAPLSAPMVQTVGDPISTKLAAIHHVSQAIKSLRWMRQLQSSGDCASETAEPPSPMKFSVCACGDADCIEVCDIRQWLPTSKLDHRLWKLVLLLGESYLALAQAYKEGRQLHQALKVVELACSVYGSMPRHLGGTKFISSMVGRASSLSKHNEHTAKARSSFDIVKDVNLGSDGEELGFEQFSSNYLFWAKAWTLVGDVYVEFHMIKGREISTQAANQPIRELRMSSEVVKEVKRLKKKLGHFDGNCRSCSLINCSCENDRVSSGSSASSSSGDTGPAVYSRRHGRRSFGKNVSYSKMGDAEERRSQHRVEDGSSEGVQRSKKGASEEAPLTRHSICSESLDKAESRTVGGTMRRPDVGPVLSREMNLPSKGIPKVRNGGIFKYVDCAMVGEGESNLLAALSCYEEAKKALGGLASGSAELHTVFKKKGWVFNELGRKRLERKELSQAEASFSEAIKAFREVSDHTNIILINCNMGHGRRALAEEMVTKVENLKLHSVFYNAYKQALETAKTEYSNALKFYGAAKSELNAVEKAVSVPDGMRNEVHTQFAHTYLRLGMLLAREDITAEVYENAAFGEISIGAASPSAAASAKKGSRKHEISANEAIREALSVYESLGEIRKQEAAYAYFQLACYQRDCCLKFLSSDHKKGSRKGENGIQQRVKQYASLAERNWQKALDFYGPKTHPTMYLAILTERSKLALSLSSSLHSNAMLESALSRMLEGRHILESVSSSLQAEYPEVHGKFWSQLQMVLKRMVAVALSSSTTGKQSCSAVSVPPLLSSNRFGDPVKLKELYKMSLKCADLSELDKMHSLWTS
ncbi:uncharacterized protein LOC116201997 [Punica granatum]|uniref:Uncharacterized protein LOC116201997 n=1 Tax=Punica granatum TaxID=22663 RepID=A0A218W0D5_PUNGR|nr:uncharacterized protein LOC116201997 [Punica granatum]OWM65731.1 hypothetical protein CDL15_Pgr015155 [Punica granatum]